MAERAREHTHCETTLQPATIMRHALVLQAPTSHPPMHRAGAFVENMNPYNKQGQTPLQCASSSTSS